MTGKKIYELSHRQTLYGLGISLLFLLLLHFCIPVLKSESKQINTFQETLHKKETQVEKLITGLAKDLGNNDYNDLFKNNLKKYESLYSEKGFVLLVYENDSLKFWSDNHIPVENFLLKICLDSKIVKLNNGFFEVRRRQIDNRVIIGLILIKNDFSFNNDYLKDEFAIGFQLPSTAELSEFQTALSYGVYSKEKHYLFSIGNLGSDNLIWADYIQIAFFLSALLFFILLLEKFCFGRLHRFGFYTYYLTFGIALAALRWFMLKFSFPEMLYSTELFSPAVYAHTSYIPSLGDLLLHATLLAIYLYTLYTHVKSNSGTNPPNYIKLIAFNLAFALLTVLCINVIISLVNDSKINLNINNLISLNAYSYLGYISIGLLLAALYFSGQAIIIKQKKYALKIYIGWLILAIMLGIVFPIFKLPFEYMLIPLLWFALQELLEYNDFTGSYTTKSIFYLSIASIFTTFILRNEIKLSNQQKLKILAENLAIERDPVAEFLSVDLKNKIPTDSVLINSLLLNSDDDNIFLNRLKQKYFNGYWEKFDISFYAYDSLCNPISKSPGAVYDKYSFFEDLFAQNKRNNFCYLPAEKGAKSGFLLKYELYKKINNRQKFIAHVFIEADSKYLSDEIGFPLLLLDNTVDNQGEFSNLSFAIYRDGQLNKHHGKFIYNSLLSFYNEAISGNTNSYFNFRSYQHYLLKNNSNTYIVSIKNENWFNALTFFSYLFSIYSLFFLFLIMIVNPDRILSLRQYTLRNRIQSLPMAMVLVALILFGLGTVYFLVRQYEQKNAENLTERLQSVLREVEYKLGDENSISFSSQEYLTYILSKFSNVFLADINLYDPDGNLIALSRPKIIEEGLISGKMNPEAYLQMVINKQAQFINKEEIGNLNYLSAYIPFVNSNNKLMGYLNIPYFAKQTDLENEISTLLVTLINIYVFLTVISLLVTLFIANRITGPLQMLQLKLANITLGKKNEPIEWNNNDEIGNLIIEYNRMILELGESAERLAKSERESAWREMAKQVAHEIKNPLTPLRLNAQLIQRAYDEKSPQFDEKFKKFTNMLIEQVDTLSQIASEFSNFAVMPKPKLFPVKLSEVIQNAVTLFRTTTSSEIIFNNHTQNDWIEADKEQLLRVFNNLIKNALQAIADEQNGHVIINLHEEDKQLLVQVIDNGVGMNEEQKKMIFVPNFTTKTGGMGLGLAMVKNILETMQVSISFTSVEHEGTTFEMRFPRQKNQ
ncbi:MAG: ATP-binding protein [Bacteroidota bacterium]|jgi:signal transduction histidine kinase